MILRDHVKSSTSLKKETFVKGEGGGFRGFVILGRWVDGVWEILMV